MLKLIQNTSTKTMLWIRNCINLAFWVRIRIHIKQMRIHACLWKKIFWTIKQILLLRPALFCLLGEPISTNSLVRGKFLNMHLAQTSFADARFLRLRLWASQFWRLWIQLWVDVRSGSDRMRIITVRVLQSRIRSFLPELVKTLRSGSGAGSMTIVQCQWCDLTWPEALKTCHWYD